MPDSVKLITLVLAGIFFSIPMFMVDRANRRTNQAIQAQGFLTHAEILGYEKRKHLYVEYKFTPEGHEMPFTTKKRIGGWGLKKAPVGSIVRVWHLRNAPSISVLEPYLSTQDAAS